MIYITLGYNHFYVNMLVALFLIQFTQKKEN